MAIPLTLKDRIERLEAEIGKIAQNSVKLPTAVTYPTLDFLNNFYHLLIEGQNDGVLTEESRESVDLLVAGYYFGFKENVSGISAETHRLIIQTLTLSGWLPSEF